MENPSRNLYVAPNPHLHLNPFISHGELIKTLVDKVLLDSVREALAGPSAKRTRHKVGSIISTKVAERADEHLPPFGWLAADPDNVTAFVSPPYFSEIPTRLILMSGKLQKPYALTNRHGKGIRKMVFAQNARHAYQRPLLTDFLDDTRFKNIFIIYHWQRSGAFSAYAIYPNWADKSLRRFMYDDLLELHKGSFRAESQKVRAEGVDVDVIIEENPEL